MSPYVLVADRATGRSSRLVSAIVHALAGDMAARAGSFGLSIRPPSVVLVAPSEMHLRGLAHMLLALLPDGYMHRVANGVIFHPNADPAVYLVSEARLDRVRGLDYRTTAVFVDDADRLAEGLYDERLTRFAYVAATACACRPLIDPEVIALAHADAEVRRAERAADLAALREPT